MEDAVWQAETYARLLMLTGGVGGDELTRAHRLLIDFSHFWPEASERWRDKIEDVTGVRP